MKLYTTTDARESSIIHFSNKQMHAPIHIAQKKKDVTRKEREKDDADGGGEKKSIHTRKTSEFSRMRIAYLRQTGFNGKIAFLYVRAPTHFVYFCVLCVLARARAFFKKV